MRHRAEEGGTQTVAEEPNLAPRSVWEYEEGGGGTQGRRLNETEAEARTAQRLFVAARSSGGGTAAGAASYEGASLLSSV